VAFVSDFYLLVMMRIFRDFFPAIFVAMVEFGWAKCHTIFSHSPFYYFYAFNALAGVVPVDCKKMLELFLFFSLLPVEFMKKL
jgi:hypothetical protein